MQQCISCPFIASPISLQFHSSSTLKMRQWKKSKNSVVPIPQPILQETHRQCQAILKHFTRLWFPVFHSFHLVETGDTFVNKDHSFLRPHSSFGNNAKTAVEELMLFGKKKETFHYFWLVLEFLPQAEQIRNHA